MDKYAQEIVNIDNEIHKIDVKLSALHELTNERNQLTRKKHFIEFLQNNCDGTIDTMAKLVVKYFQVHHMDSLEDLVSYTAERRSRELIEGISKELYKIIAFCTWTDLRRFIDHSLQYVFGSIGQQYTLCIANTILEAYNDGAKIIPENNKSLYFINDLFWEVKGSAICEELKDVEYVEFAKFLDAVVKKFKEDSYISGAIANK